MTLPKRASSIIHTEGYVELFRRISLFLYDRLIRPIIPRSGFYHKNEIRWREKKFIDSIAHPNWSDNPEYERALISAIRDQVKRGDIVGIIGGGRGISTIAAAERTGKEGTVTVYEASLERIHWIRRTIKLNDSRATINVKHGLVGPNVLVYGEMGDVSRVSPSELPDFNILEMRPP